MSMTIRTVSVSALAMLSLTACATTGKLHEEMVERSYADSALMRGLAEERLARATTDSVHRAELLAQRDSIAALRNDLTGLRTEFGAKISEVANGLKFVLPVHFGFDQATVRTEDVAALELFAKVAQKHYGGAKITVEGFTDPAGSPRYNVALSKRRANAVREFISARGIDNSLVSAVGYGETRLVAKGASREMPGAELNRRVTFVIETGPNRASNTMALLNP